MNKRTILRACFAALILGGLLMLGLCGCFAPKVRLMYSEGIDAFRGAKETYRAGAHVRLVYDGVGTYTDYTFLLDDEPIRTDYKPDKGYILRFVMPDHDATLTVKTEASMGQNDTALSGKTVTLTFSSFDGGGPQYSVRIDDPSVLSYTSERRYARADHAELDGAAFDDVFTFKGLKAGTATVIVSADSPIVEEEDRVYAVTVDADLRVSMQEQEIPSDVVRPIPTLVLLTQNVQYFPSLAETPSSTAFVEKLSREPIAVDLQTDGGLLCGDLPWMLPQDDAAEITAQPGDILLLEDGRIAVCAQQTDGAFTRLASVDDDRTQQLLQALGDSASLMLWVEWSE